ncbi:hypothetical protein [Anaerolentibacter hominis]|uniref:hypothetical protein n=1 Tax=Anaerolentibacter hominis TaxID=3079009 RepID=UPI0031B85E85
MGENVYKTMNTVGSMAIILGILTIVLGVASGVLNIVNGAMLLKKKSDLLF